MKEYFQIKHRDTALALKDFSKTTHTHERKDIGNIVRKERGT